MRNGKQISRLTYKSNTHAELNINFQLQHAVESKIERTFFLSLLLFASFRGGGHDFRSGRSVTVRNLSPLPMLFFVPASLGCEASGQTAVKIG